MSDVPYIAIVVEGSGREPNVIKNMLDVYFNRAEFKIISLPAEQNIYMLWSQLKEDDFETDIIEVLREYSAIAEKELEGLERDDFSEVYLFFDYDNHQNNLPNGVNPNEVIYEMLQRFDNENELGKLYINYPMIEALRDLVPNYCSAKTSCYVKKDMLTTYKNRTAQNNPVFEQMGQYEIEQWKLIIDGFAMRVSCFFEFIQVMNYEQYRHSVSPITIYERQRRYASKCFVLSAIPQFIVDYFGEKIWASHVKHTYLNPSVCNKS